jgi:hypothetical protein
MKMNKKIIFMGKQIKNDIKTLEDHIVGEEGCIVWKGILKNW